MSPRGGIRKGAGRPVERTEPLVAMTLRLEPDLLAKWNKEKKRLNLSGPELLAKFLKWKKKQPKSTIGKVLDAQFAKKKGRKSK